MGRIVVEKPIEGIRFHIKMKWNESMGVLLIYDYPKDSSNVSIIVNEVEYVVEFDKDGITEIEFQKSNPQIFYSVRIKNKVDDKTDQKIGLWY